MSETSRRTSRCDEDTQRLRVYRSESDANSDNDRDPEPTESDAPTH